MELYYRVLYTEEHFASYNAGIVTSHHHGTIPGTWQAKWYQAEDRNLEDTDRKTVRGTLSTLALEAFLEIAPTHEFVNEWSESEIHEVSELEGLCGFTTPQAAFIFGQQGPFAIANKNRYVEFEGIYVCDAPDDPNHVNIGTAVQAKWIKYSTELMNANEFCNRYGLQWLQPRRG